ncbi:MAG: ATP-binding cassette domain-containing protein, partial [Candidatus Adiutrix sp.]
MHSQTFIRLENISKSFGQVRANRNISLNFAKGKIKALLGENGAGKSTLMAMLAGQLQPDAGQILINGARKKITSPKIAHNLGIGMVYQHFMLVESMTVAENVLLGQGKSFTFSPASIEKEVSELAKTYFIEIDPAAKVESLSMGERQRVEILKLLRRKSELLIFDEPTAVLTPAETEHLFTTLKQMARLGKAIV